MGKSVYHIPALLRETIEGLDIQPGGVYADATFGGGGHSRAILNELGPTGRLYGFDRDIDAYANCPNDGRFTFVHSNFRYMHNFMRYYGVSSFDGILADLGVSFHHFDDANRGFSFRADAPLDMRMNQSQELTASKVVNEYDEKRLEEIFKTYTDLKRPDRVARSIIKGRATGEILTTDALTTVLTPVLNPKNLKKDLAQAYQAIRIEVNGEMESLRKFLESIPKMVHPGSRLVVLTYHSIEDRIVKNYMKTGRVDGEEEKDFYGRSMSPWKILTRSPITATEREVEENPRARSAKLRIAEYKGPERSER